MDKFNHLRGKSCTAFLGLKIEPELKEAIRNAAKAENKIGISAWIKRRIIEVLKSEGRLK